MELMRLTNLMRVKGQTGTSQRLLEERGSLYKMSQLMMETPVSILSPFNRLWWVLLLGTTSSLWACSFSSAQHKTTKHNNDIFFILKVHLSLPASDHENQRDWPKKHKTQEEAKCEQLLCSIQNKTVIIIIVLDLLVLWKLHLTHALDLLKQPQGMTSRSGCKSLPEAAMIRRLPGGNEANWFDGSQWSSWGQSTSSTHELN